MWPARRNGDVPPNSASAVSVTDSRPLMRAKLPAHERRHAGDAGRRLDDPPAKARGRRHPSRAPVRGSR